MTKFMYCDTKRENGVYTRFEMVLEPDTFPHDPQKEDEGISRKRLEAFVRGDWWFVGVRAKAIIEVVTSGCQVTYQLLSPGLWGIESDAGEDYVNSVFEDECEILRNDLTAIGAHFAPKKNKWFIVEHSGMANEGPDGRSDPYDTFEEAYQGMKEHYTEEEIEEWPVKIAVDRGDGALSYDF